MIKAFQYLKNYREFKFDLKNTLDQIKINNKKITTTIKNQFYKKDIYLFMTKEMEYNIILKDNFPYFCNVTYYSLPPKLKNIKYYQS